MTANQHNGNEKTTAASEPDVTRLANAGAQSDDFETEFELDDAAPDVGKGALLAVIGDYVLLNCIGVGGMGEVYRAEHRMMKRQVALKILGQAIANKPRVIDRFFQEIRAVARLMHPNIVTAFDAGTQNGTHYLVMELVDGELLSDRVANTGLFSTQEAVSILYQAAQALDYAHSQGIIHRDIKPNNMMLAKDGTLKILDFGLAQLERPGDRVAGPRRFMGTVEYMSPEQVEDSERVDFRSDLYSLGATLFFLVTGRPMFTGEPMQIAQAQLRDKPPALYDVRSDIDLRLDAVFQRLVAKAPADRIPSAKALIEVIEQLSLHETNATIEERIRFPFAHRPATENPTRHVSSQSTVSKSLTAVGIDLGMIASTAGYFDPTSGPRIVDHPGSVQHLRNMLWSDREHFIVGAEALGLRQNQPDKIFHSLQRWIGLKKVERPLAGKHVPPEVLIATVVRTLLHSIHSHVPDATQAVITVPGCYDQLHRNAIHTACQIAGVEVLQLLDKSLAAALTWIDLNARISTLNTADLRSNPTLLVVHLGGSGLDASVIQIQGLNAIQKSTCGSTKLGSLRWHNRLAEYLADLIQKKTGHTIREDVSAATRLQRTVEITMDRLAKSPKIAVRFDWMKQTIQEPMTQARLVELAPGLVGSLRDTILQALRLGGSQPTRINHVLLVGSLLNMDPLHRMMAELFPHRPPMTNMHKSDLARGAILHAHQLMPFAATSVATPRAIGCVSHDLGLMITDPSTRRQQPRSLILRGTELPTAESRNLKPRGNGRKHVLQIVEGASLDTTTWMKLGSINATDAFADRSQTESLQIQLSVNESGLLNTTLSWPNGKRFVTVPALSEPAVSPETIPTWRDWLADAFAKSKQFVDATE